MVNKTLHFALTKSELGILPTAIPILWGYCYVVVRVPFKRKKHECHIVKWHDDMGHPRLQKLLAMLVPERGPF